MTDRPALPDEESNDRARRQEVRAMLLLESFGGDDRVLSDWLRATLGDDRAATMGPPDTSANTLLTVAQQLSTPGLYGLGAPMVRHRDEAGALPVILAMQDGGVWERMQFVELMARGLGDWVLRVEVDDDGVRVRNAEPWNVWTRVAPDRYDHIIELRERRLRADPLTGEHCWCWDVYSVAAGAECYAVYDGDGAPVSNLYLTMPDGTPAPPDGLRGAAYPYRWRDGRPFLPFVFYATMDTGSVWHEMGRRGATKGALNSITYHTYVGKVAHSATGTAVIAVGLQPPGAPMAASSQPDSAPSISLNPGEILFLQPREGVNTASVTQVGPGANLDVLSRYALTYEAQQAYREGLSADDLSKDQANPESAAALALKNSGKRAAAARITPHFRRRDQDLIGRVAAMMRLYGLVDDAPERGYSIEYRPIPTSADELTAALDYGLKQRESGLLSTVDLYLQIHPGMSRDAAIAELRRIRSEEATLNSEPAAELPQQDTMEEEAAPADAEMVDVPDEDVLMRETLEEAAQALATGDTQAAQLAIAQVQGMMMADMGEDVAEEEDGADAS
jgi:hypothetical protein